MVVWEINSLGVSYWSCICAQHVIPEQDSRVTHYSLPYWGDAYLLLAIDL